MVLGTKRCRQIADDGRALPGAETSRETPLPFKGQNMSNAWVDQRGGEMALPGASGWAKPEPQCAESVLKRAIPW